jgi:hypothetical protein
MISWETCKKDFRADGILRDIYITPATVDDWRAAYRLICAYPGAEYSVAGVVQPPPTLVEQVFAVRPSGPMLRSRAGRAFVVFHFFSDQEIECDIDPSEIASERDLDALISFMRQLGDVTRKRVLITPESCPEVPFVTYDPERRKVEHHEVPG